MITHTHTHAQKKKKEHPAISFHYITHLKTTTVCLASGMKPVDLNPIPNFLRGSFSAPEPGLETPVSHFVNLGLPGILKPVSIPDKAYERLEEVEMEV